MERGDLTIKSLAEHLEIHKKAEGKSPQTIEWYAAALKIFHDWLQAEQLSTSIDDIGPEQVRRFILYLQGRKGVQGQASTYTVNNRFRAIKAFFGWLHDQKYTETHKLITVKAPKVTEKVIEILEEEEVLKLFATMNPDTVLGARNTAIVILMLDTGLRLSSEVVHLKFMDVHLKERRVKVLGKGNKERVVGFGLSCQKSLIDYVHRFLGNPARPDVDTLFLAIDGYSMARDALRSLMKRLAESSGITRLHPHLLRHTYATYFSINGGDPFSLQHNLGHTTLAMVQRYVHLASQVVAVRSQGGSPMDGFRVLNGRRFRHSFNPENFRGMIYPNAGRRGHKRAWSRRDKHPGQ